MIDSVDSARGVCAFPGQPREEYLEAAPSGDDPDTFKGFWTGEPYRRLLWGGQSYDGSYGGGPYTWWRVSSRPDGSGLLLERVAAIGGWTQRGQPTAQELVTLFGAAAREAG